MTNQEYTKAMDDAINGIPITRKTAEKLAVTAREAKIHARLLRRQKRFNEASWFRDNAGEIRAVLKTAVIEPAC